MLHLRNVRLPEGSIAIGAPSCESRSSFDGRVTGAPLLGAMARADWLKLGHVTALFSEWEEPIRGQGSERLGHSKDEF